GFDAVMVTVTEMAGAGAAPLDIRRELGRVARKSATMTEAEWLGVFADMADWPWPERFACTGVDVESGEFVVWDQAAGARLQAAVASSCAVPGIFPPVTIDGRRYMDGGMRTALNADVAAGHDVVVAVSCMALALPPGVTDPLFELLIGETRSEMETVAAAGGQLEVIEPGAEFLEISGWGLNLMDFSRVEAAITAGFTQAAVEADRLRAAWNT
ncbi:MAG: patatin-like phospholipase family protein, partial [Acidimicrobiales bacterium]